MWSRAWTRRDTCIEPAHDPEPPAESLARGLARGQLPGFQASEGHNDGSGDMDEKTIGELTVRIDRLICVGFGDCIEVSPEAFELDDEGVAIFRPGVEGVSPEELIESCESCPVDALTVLDVRGVQIVP